ncbi:MAG: crotonyl-CoA carboxylase/reductase [Deltaproteobacteria bacterium]|nr:crotonyl-CoA carboxylase/reductase [Deltaproteobacteria bacterium]
MAEKQIPIGKVPGEVGALPESMKAWVIREERHGEPLKAFQLEDMPIPEIGATEVLVLVMAAGVNYNNVWAALGTPVTVSQLHKGIDHHIGGSDASGIVWKVGSEVKYWKPGDEVVIHCNQSCGQCPECNGLDPLACAQQKIWGYETSWGSFAQFTKVQAQQLLPKPKHLTWEEAASYALVYLTAYRMLVDQCRLKAGDNVMVWGAAGGLGGFAVQICRLFGANAVGIVSSEEKKKLVMQLGGVGAINRKDYDFARRDNETPDQIKNRAKETRRLGKALREFWNGRDADIVFEHVGQQTFPASVILAKTFGKIVICGATSGFNLDFDVRYLWMRQKQIIGSHFCNAYEANRANQLIVEKKIEPVLGKVFPWEGCAEAHQVMHENRHSGNMVILVQAEKEGMGKTG